MELKRVSVTQCLSCFRTHAAIRSAAFGKPPVLIRREMRRKLSAWFPVRRTMPLEQKSKRAAGFQPSSTLAIFEKRQMGGKEKRKKRSRPYPAESLFLRLLD